MFPNQSFLFECNTERGCIDQLYIELGVQSWLVRSSFMFIGGSINLLTGFQLLVPSIFFDISYYKRPHCLPNISNIFNFQILFVNCEYKGNPWISVFPWKYARTCFIQVLEVKSSTMWRTCNFFFMFWGKNIFPL